MGFKLAFILGLLLVASSAGSVMYIKYLNAQLVTLKGNQIVLETKIVEQNNSIENYLSRQSQVNDQLAELESAKNDALREVSKLKNTFAKHDLDNLALVKPKLIEGVINRGTAKVMSDLTTLTDPNQFDEGYNEENSTPD
jgi:hypothetical protein